MPRKTKLPKPVGACIIPTKPMRPEKLRESVLERSETDEVEITRYFEWQSEKDPAGPAKVVHLEKVRSERIWGRQYDVWDIHATDARWWVITNPTNLYRQLEFPSLDYTLSFHVGLMARVAARDSRRTDDDNAERFAAAWRRWEQAADAVELANEAEDFQAIGMRCRECLLAFIRSAQENITFQESTVAPKKGDFILWSDLLANWLAPGEHSQCVRKYLKDITSSTWKLVNWLTHATNVTLIDAELSVRATEQVLGALSRAFIRRESRRPDRCPKCSSYQLDSNYVPETESVLPYNLSCKACGSLFLPPRSKEATRKEKVKHRRPA